MTEPDRVPCCIHGCKRSFKREPGDADGQVLCGKHFRCDMTLVRRLRSRRRLMRWAERRLRLVERKPRDRRWRGRSGIAAQKLERVIDQLYRDDNRLWRRIMNKAQQMQDAGFWAPRPRIAKNKRIAEKAVLSKAERRKSDRFEDQFQRLKQAQQGAR